MNVLIVPCSIRPGGLSPRLAQLLVAALKRGGATTTEFDLRRLPFHGASATADYPPEVEEWRQSILASDAIIWLTPTYHNSLPGVAKSALDLLDARVMRGKPSGIVGASNLTAEPGAIALGNVVRFIGGLLPIEDLYVPNLNVVWPRGAEPPEGIVEAVEAWAPKLLAAISRDRG